MSGHEGLPWPEGDPGALRASAGRLADVAGELQSAAGRLGRATGRPAGWSSSAASAFTALAGDQLQGLRGGAVDLCAGATAVRELADAVEAAQDVVREQAALVREARQAAEAAPPPDPLLPSSLGSLDPAAQAQARYAAVLGAARVVAEQAVQRVEDADRRCAGWLDGVGRILVASPGGMPSGPSGGGGISFDCPTDDPAVRSLFDGLSGAAGMAGSAIQAGGRPLADVFTEAVDGKVGGQGTIPLNDLLKGMGACIPPDLGPPNPPPPPPPPPPRPAPPPAPAHPGKPFWPDAVPTPADAWDWYDQANTDAADWTREAYRDSDEWLSEHLPDPNGGGGEPIPIPIPRRGPA